jgi:hypothetical protein
MNRLNSWIKSASIDTTKEALLVDFRSETLKAPRLDIRIGSGKRAGNAIGHAT